MYVCHLMQRGKHAALQLLQPLLHLAASLGGGDDVQQLHHLALAALHVGDVQHVGEDHTGDALKALLQVGLHSVRGKEARDRQELMLKYSLSVNVWA